MFGANMLRMKPNEAITDPIIVTLLHPYRFVRALAMGPEMQINCKNIIIMSHLSIL